jgi:protein-disulfide isomerase
MMLAWLPAILHAQDVQEITADGEKAILSKPAIGAIGARNADVIIVEYFDYNCPYCKKFTSTLRTLMAGDPKIAVLYKDWPVLGDVSVYAARCALAAQWQGKYLIAHDALLGGPHLSQNAQVDSVLGRAGVDLSSLTRDRARHAEEIDAELARIDSEADALGIRGTPSILVGRLLVSGIVDAHDMQALIAQVRQGR